MKKIARIFICLILIGAILEANTPETDAVDHLSHLTSLAIEGARMAAKPVIGFLQHPQESSQILQDSLEPIGDILVCQAKVLWDRVSIVLEFLETQIERGTSPVKCFFQSISDQLS